MDKMKKRYHLLAVTLLTTLVSTAQVDIKEYNQGNIVENNLNGTIISRVVSEDELVIVDLAVVNKFGSDKILSVTRDKLVDVPAWSNGNLPQGVPAEQICWGPVPDPTFKGVCMNPDSDPWTTPNSFILPNNGFANMKFDIHTTGPGTIHYRFHVMDGSTKVDSVDVYLTTILGIKDKKSEEISMSIYPNPASFMLNISAQGLDGNYDVRMTDVLGKVVYNETVVGTSKKVDISDFKNGVYLVTVLEKGMFSQTRRVVIKN